MTTTTTESRRNGHQTELRRVHPWTLDTRQLVADLGGAVRRSGLCHPCAGLAGRQRRRRHHPANADALNHVGIEEIVDHYVQIINGKGFQTKPVAVGHSFGGLIAQRLLAADHVAAAVAIDPAQIKGVKSLPFSQVKATFPVLKNPANRRRTVALTAKQVRYGFANAVPEE
jgi:pimeloyl-ACP methyl ester carboxylesterase